MGRYLKKVEEELGEEEIGFETRSFYCKELELNEVLIEKQQEELMESARRLAAKQSTQEEEEQRKKIEELA